jgi:hypothetical protein
MTIWQNHVRQRQAYALEFCPPTAGPSQQLFFSQTFLRAKRTPTKHNPNNCGVMDNF